MTTSTRTRSSIGLWILQVVTAAAFLMAALGKFAGAEPAASTFEAIGLGDWLRHLVGVLEVAGVIGLLVPPLTGLAALAFVALMIGATIVQVVVVGGGAFLPLVLLALCLVIAWGRRDSTVRLWSDLRSRRVHKI
ncbi:DoxX family protein [Nonomuraea sp. NPDC050790]|uniref:DoxX family protein n=1 Tax=Nonomuraea sp. NPDC050790 TaxID=3364371 RepID=UPI003790D758